jgi:predicted nucleic acid-binding Zn ribbon protein
MHQSFSDTPLKRCPECGKLSLHKVFTPVSVIYKGSGFYSTDHRSSSYTSTAATQKKKGQKPGEKKGETAKETNPKETTPKSEAPSD